MPECPEASWQWAHRTATSSCGPGVPDHPRPSITVMPHIQDGEGGWYVVIGGEEVAGPYGEDEAARVLKQLLDA